jgi:hypothetical protein
MIEVKFRQGRTYDDTVYTILPILLTIEEALDVWKIQAGVPAAYSGPGRGARRLLWSKQGCPPPTLVQAGAPAAATLGSAIFRAPG